MEETKESSREKYLSINKNGKKRIVIIGAGFAGLKLSTGLKGKDFQVVLIDRNNYHQFQPLFYQVASAGIEPSSIAFPLRKVFQKQKDIHIRVTEVKEVVPAENILITSSGIIQYDVLVIATGADTNYFGLKSIEENALAMKSVSESMLIRNTILENFEKTLYCQDKEGTNCLMNVAVIGGGATGVELAGAIADMKKYVLPKDYPELDFSRMKIYLIEATGKLLGTLSVKASQKARKYLEKMGVDVLLNTQVADYDGITVILNDGNKIFSKTVIWTAGIKGNALKGLNENIFTPSGRIRVDNYCKVDGYERIYALGDVACMLDVQYPRGHPQVAQVAIQQAKLLCENLMREKSGKPLKSFKYKDLGTMATVGRNLAVVDFGHFHFGGLFAWFFWMFIHLMAIVGVKNRLIIFVNWFWNYVTYDQSLRLILKIKDQKGD